MKPQGTVGRDVRGYHVSTGVMSGTSTACFGEEGEGDITNRKIPKPMKSGCQMKAFSPAAAIQYHTNNMLTFSFRDIVDPHFPIIL